MADQTLTPRLREVSIDGFRSIGDDPVSLVFPSGKPLVLIGENNAGKSNIVRALGILFGETWPPNCDVSDHDYYGRNSPFGEFHVNAKVSGLRCPYCIGAKITGLRLTVYGDPDRENDLRLDCENNCNQRPNRAFRHHLQTVTINADRDLSYQLSYTSKGTALSRLMRRFHVKLMESEDRRNDLTNLHEQLLEVFDGVPEFKGFSDELKRTSGVLSNNMPYGLEFNFSAYDPSNYFRALRIFPESDGTTRAFDELGTGQGQLLSIAFSYAYAKSFAGDGLVLIVEEPESHLHPLSQQWVASKLAAMSTEGVQVLVTTHSPYFVNLASTETVALVRKEADSDRTTALQLTSSELATNVVELGGSATMTKAATIGPYFEDSSTVALKAGLFSRCVVLVEGTTESNALPEFLSRLGMPTQPVGIDIIPVGGLNLIPRWLRYFKSYGVTVYPIFDTDRDKTAAEEDGREYRLEILQALGIDDPPDWSSKDDRRLRVYPAFAIFDSDFETAAKAMFGTNYTEVDAEGKKQFGESKSLRARYLARHLDYPEDDQITGTGWEILKRLGTRLYKHVNVNAPEQEQ